METVACARALSTKGKITRGIWMIYSKVTGDSSSKDSDFTLKSCSEVKMTAMFKLCPVSE